MKGVREPRGPLEFAFWGMVLIVFLAQLRGVDGLQLIAKVTTIVTIAAAFIGHLKVPSGPEPLHRDAGIRLAALYFVAVILSYLFAEKNPIGPATLETTVGALLLFGLLLALADTQRRAEWVVLVILASTFISSSVVIYDSITGQFLFTDEIAIVGELGRSGGTYGSPVGSAAMILAGTIMGLVLALRTKWIRPIAAATAFVGTWALIVSFSRSAGLIYLLVLALILFGARHHRFFPAICLGAVVCVIVALVLMPEHNWTRLEALTDFQKDRTLFRRIAYNVIGLDLVVQYPLFGIGPKNFPNYFPLPEYRWLPGRTLGGRALHNMYLEVIVHHGIVGFIPFLALMLYAFRGVHRVIRTAVETRIQAMAEAVFFASIGFFLMCGTLAVQNNRYVWILMALMIAIARLIPKPAATPRKTCEQKPALRPFVSSHGRDRRGLGGTASASDSGQL